MNSTQKNYLTNRIEDISRDKMMEIKKGGKTELTDQEKYNLIKWGKAKLLSFKGCQHRYGHSFSNLDDCFDFSKYEKPFKVNQKKIDAKIEKLRVATQQMKDEAILGDRDEAIKLMAKFRSMKI